MKTRRLVALFTLVLVLSSFSFVSAQDGLTIGAQAQATTVGVEETAYEPGDSVEIYGNAGSLANVSITVFDGYAYILELNVTADEDGEYEVEFDLPEDAVNGTYTVTASTDGETLHAYFYVMVQDPEELAETLISQAEDGRDSVEDLLEELEEGGIDATPEANESYTQGVLALGAAQAHFDDGNYTEAGDYAYEAIQLFGDAFKQLWDLIPVEPTDEGDEDDGDGADAESLAAAIDRAFAYWERLNATVLRLEGEGYNVTLILKVLDETYDHLVAASEELLAGNHTGAVEEFRSARTVLGRIQGYIQSKVEEHKTRQAEQFMEQFQRRIQSINGTIERLRESLQENVTSRVRGVITATMNRLQQLRRKIAAGLSEADLEEALEDLEEAVEDIEEGVETLGERYSANIKSMNQVEAKIRVLNKTAERLARKGEDVAGFQSQMADAEGYLEQLRERFQAGDFEDIGEMLEEAHERFREAQRNLKESSLSQLKERIKEQMLDRIQEKLHSPGGGRTNSTGGP